MCSINIAWQEIEISISQACFVPMCVLTSIYIMKNKHKNKQLVQIMFIMYCGSSVGVAPHSMVSRWDHHILFPPITLFESVMTKSVMVKVQEKLGQMEVKNEIKS